MNNSKKHDPRFRKLWENSGALRGAFRVDYDWLDSWIYETQIKKAQQNKIDIILVIDIRQNCLCGVFDGDTNCNCPFYNVVTEICVINPLLLDRLRCNLEKLGWEYSDRQDLSLPVFFSGLNWDEFITKLSKFGCPSIGTMYDKKMTSTYWP